MQLVQNGADVTATAKTKGFKGEGEDRKEIEVVVTALFFTLLFADEDALWSALIHPSLINVIHENGTRSLHLAASTRHNKLINILISAGADNSAKDTEGNFPLNRYFDRLFTPRCPANARAILQLIPQGERHPLDLVSLLLAFRDYFPDEKEYMKDVFSTLLMQTTKQDFFSSYSLSSGGPSHCEFIGWKFKWPYKLNMDWLRIICILLRKGLGSRTSPGVHSALMRAKEDPSCQGGFEDPDVFKKADELDGLFDGVYSLFDECRFSIREVVQCPTLERLQQLPLPKKLIDKLLFVDVAEEIVRLIQETKDKA